MKKKAIMMPYNHKGNSYIDNFQSFLSEHFEFYDYSFSNSKLCSFIFLHWRENKFCETKNGVTSISFSGFFKEMLRLFVFKMHKNKIVIVRHNVYPHNLTGYRIALVKFMQAIYYGFADVLFCHSPVFSKNNSYNYLPHPKYKQLESENFNLQVPSSLDCNISNKRFLIFGRVVPYKKIELILKNMPVDCFIDVVGPCEDEEYLAFLKRIARRNVNFDIGFKTESELTQLVTNCDFVLLAADSADMIVSGSLHFALSLSKPVFCIKNEYTQWLKDNFYDINIFLLDDYSNISNFSAAEFTDINPTLSYFEHHDRCYFLKCFEGAFNG